MKLTLYQLNLPLAHEFRIARGSITIQPSLIVELEHDDVLGYGEVTENTFYGHTFASITTSLKKAAKHLDDYIDQSPADLWPKMHDVVGGDTFALSALDMAAHDLRGRLLGVPTWRDWGLEWVDVPESRHNRD